MPFLRPAPSALLAALLIAARAEAQLPTPRVARLEPPGGARGSTVEVTLHGEHLEESLSLRFGHSSLRAEHCSEQKEKLVFRVSIGKDAPLGVHQCWTAGRYGASFPVSFAVDDLAEAVEKEPNDTRESAQAVGMESAVNGAIQAAADRDCFKLALKAGERFFAECVAQRIESNLDSTLELRDAAGKKIAANRDFQGEDAFLDATAPADGEYVLLLHDFTYQGGADRYYRLRLSARPRADFVLPAALAAGSRGEVKLFGRKLPGASPAGEHWLGGSLGVVTAVVEAPAAPAPLFTRFGGDRHPQLAKVDLFALSSPLLPAGGGPAPIEFSNSLPMGFAAGAVLIETEPNDDPKKAQPIPIPADLTGQLATEYDRDWTEFEAKKGMRLWVEAIAARMGSAIDPVLTLARADETSTFIQEVDDDGELVAGKRFDTRGADAAFRWEVPADGRYRLQVRDLAGGRRGLGLFYRLTVREEEPGFRVFLIASRPQGPDALTLRRGGSEHCEVHVLRRGGYEGTIRVEATGLPVGVAAAPAVIGPRSAFAPLVFSAEAGAPAEVSFTRVVASGWAFGERLDRPALPYVVDRTTGDDDRSPNLVRPIGGLPLAVVDEPAPFSLSAAPAVVVLRPGEKAPLKVMALRTAPFEGDIGLSPIASVPGLKVPGAKIEKGKTEVSIELSLEGGAAPGRYTLALLGEADVPYSKNPQEQKKPNVKVRSPSTAVTLDVAAPPFEVRVADLHGGKIAAGGSLNIDVALTRKLGFDAPVTLTLVPPEAVKDLQAQEVRVPRGSGGATLTVKALDGGANPGPRPDLILRASSDLFGTTVKVDVKLALEVEKKK